MDEEATVPGGARGELRWPPVMARKRPGPGGIKYL